MDDDEALMDLGIDNFNEDEVELNAFSADDSAKPVPYVTNNTSIPRKCIRKGELVCYVKNENINMINNNVQRSATPTYSVNSDSKTRSSSETDNILSGESLYKTFIFEESLNDNDTQKCIAFWKSVMEKNLTPIKCTIIENKKKRARELKVEQEKKPSIVENRDDIIKEATDKVHAEYKAMWMAALKEIKQKKLDKVKLVGQARCKLCETIENPMEEYSTDIDSVTVKEEVKGLNKWESVSKRPKRGEIRGGEELIRKLKQKEKQQTQYKFVNVIEEKKKSGTYKLWRSNLVKPPCSCGKKNCECNINPAIICMRTPLSTLMAKSTKPVVDNRPSRKEITPKSSTRSKEATPKSSVPLSQKSEEKTSSYKEMPPKSSAEEKRSYQEQVSQPIAEKTPLPEITPKPSVDVKTSYKEMTPKPSAEEKSPYKEPPKAPKEVTPQISADERKKEPLLPRKIHDEILSKPSEPDRVYLPEASSQTPRDQDSQTDKEMMTKVVPFQVPTDAAGDKTSIHSSLSDIVEDVSGVLVTRATPFIMELADSVYREISTMSTLPFADTSTFLKMPSEEFLAEVSQLVLAKARDLMENISENLIQEISQIIISKARPMMEDAYAKRKEALEDVEIEEKDTVYTEVTLHEPVTHPDQLTLTSSMKKVTSEHLSPEPSLVMERQVSVLLPTGEVQITKDRSIDVNMDTTWEKPTIIPSKVPASARKGSLEMIKARKQMVQKKPEQSIEKPPSLVAVLSNTADTEVQTDFNLSILHQGKVKPTAPSAYGADQLEKKLVVETEEFQERNLLNQKTQIDSLFVNRDTGEPDLPEEQPDNVEDAGRVHNAAISETVSVKSEFDESIFHNRRIPRDSLFVTKERVARHQKDMEEKHSDEEPDAEQISRQIRLLSEITSPGSTKKINSRLLRDSIFVNKERVAKHKADMAEESLREIDVNNPEPGQTGTPSESTDEVEMRPIDSRSLRDSIFVNKERVSKHKQDMSEDDDDVDHVQSEGRQIRISEPVGKKKKKKTLRESISRKKSSDESAKIDSKGRQVRLMSSPVDIKTPTSKKLDAGSIKDSVLVRKEAVEKTNPRMLDHHKIVKDSLYLNKERVSKHKKEIIEESVDDVDDNRQIRISENAETTKRKRNAIPIKDSIYVNKERVAKHKKEMGEEHEDIEDAELENRQIRILPEPKEGDVHIKRTNPMLTKNSIPVQKDHVAKHKPEEESVDNKEELGKHQIHITELKEGDVHLKSNKPMHAKNSIPVQKDHVAKHITEEESVDKEELGNRQIHIVDLEEGDVHIKSTKPMLLKDSVFINKERVAKHKKDMGEENESVENKNRQIRIVSTPTELEKKKKKKFSANLMWVQKRKKDVASKESHSDPPDKKITDEKAVDTDVENRPVPESSSSTDAEIDMTALRDEMIDSVTVDVEDSEKIIPVTVLRDSPNHSKIDNEDVFTPSPSDAIDLTSLLNSNQIADSIVVRKEKLEKTHLRMIRHKQTKTKDSYPVNKQKFTKRGKKNEGLISQVIYETDYEKIKEKDPIGNTESVGKESTQVCDPCYCIKCPALKITRTTGKGRKKIHSCPLHAGNKKEKKKKCRPASVPVAQQFSAVSKPESASYGTSSLKVLMSGVSAKESKYTEFE